MPRAISPIREINRSLEAIRNPELKLVPEIEALEIVILIFIGSPRDPILELESAGSGCGRLVDVGESARARVGSSRPNGSEEDEKYKSQDHSYWLGRTVAVRCGDNCRARSIQGTRSMASTPSRSRVSGSTASGSGPDDLCSMLAPKYEPMTRSAARAWKASVSTVGKSANHIPIQPGITSWSHGIGVV